MKSTVAVGIAITLLCAPLGAQENKPVPKDSVRVFVPGCSKGYIFTAGARTSDQPGSAEITEGMHLRMSGPKKLMAEIKAREGMMIEITGLMKKGQHRPDGVAIGGGVRIGPSQGMTAGPTAGQLVIDVEGWRPAVGVCPSRS